MSSQDEQDPLTIAKQAEADLNSYAAKTGASKGQSDSALESGIDESAADRFPGGSVTIGSAATGAGDNREISDEEGGGQDPETGRQTKARDFEGVGGPEDKAELRAREEGGSDEVRAENEK